MSSAVLSEFKLKLPSSDFPKNYLFFFDKGKWTVFVAIIQRDEKKTGYVKVKTI